MKVTRTQRQEDQLKWSSASDYATVLHLNRQFLRGEMMTTPYNHRPIDHETEPDPNLIRLHDYGFLVYGWQSGLHIRPTRSDLSVEDRKALFYEVQKRDFLHFLMPLELFNPDALQVFWMSLIGHPAIVTRMVCRRDATLYSGNTGPPRVTVSSNFDGDSYPILRHRAASTMDGLKDAVYKTIACVPPDPAALDHTTWKCDAVLSTLPQEFWVVTRSWNGEIRVGALIESLALVAGLKMAFAEGDAGDVGSAAGHGIGIEDEIGR